MIRIKYKIVNYISCLCVCMCLFAACQDNQWDDRYDPDNEFNGQTLLELIEKNPDLSEFYKILKEVRMDSILSTQQSFTVWAPTNDVLASYIPDKNSANQFVKNHIARFVYSSSDLNTENSIRIKMLNGKYQYYSKQAAGITMADAKVGSKTWVASNGVLQTVDNVFPFNLNLWERFTGEDNVDLIAEYLTSFDEYIFDPNASIPIRTNEFGQTEYDSVFIHRNKWLSNFGRIEKEDSVYMAIIPTDVAWNDAFTRINPYFRTVGEMLEETINPSTYITKRTYAIGDTKADSLQLNHTKETITQDLLFRQKTNYIPRDSITSTNGNVFYNPSYLFAGATYNETSNGWAYITDRLHHKAKESWHKKIVLEAEQYVSRFRYATLSTRIVVDTTEYLYSVSGGKYLEVANTTSNPNMQPYAIFNIPNTLAAKYDIYCVFAPRESYEPGRADTTKVRFTLNYVHENGNMFEDAAITTDPVTGKVFTTNPTGMTKMLVAKGFKFPYANYSGSRFSYESPRVNVLLKIQTNVSNNETNKYNRIMRIDQLILEPVNE